MQKKKKSAPKKSTRGKKRPKVTQDKLMSQLSYGLRNPLNAIIGFSELLSTKKAGDLNRKQQEYLNDIVSSAKEILNFLHKTVAANSSVAKPKKASKKSKKKRS